MPLPRAHASAWATSAAPITPIDLHGHLLQLETAALKRLEGHATQHRAVLNSTEMGAELIVLQLLLAQCEAERLAQHSLAERESLADRAQSQAPPQGREWRPEGASRA